MFKKRLFLNVVQQVGKWLLRLSVVCLFVIVSLLVVMYAYGYQYDARTGGLVKTSIIDFNFVLDNIDLYVDGEWVSDRAPFRMKGVGVGFHSVRIERPGFYTWEKKLKVLDGFVTRVNLVLLLPFDVVGELKKGSEVFDSFYFGNDFMVTFDNNLRSLKFVKFLADGTSSVVMVDFEGQVKLVQSVADERVAVYFEDGRVGVFETERFSEEETFVLAGGESPYLDWKNRKIYYLEGGFLKTKELSGEEREVILGRGDFYLPFDGGFYVLRGGLLSVMDSDGDNWRMVHRFPAEVTGIELAGDRFFLVNRDKLYYLGDDNVLAEVEQDVSGFVPIKSGLGLFYYKRHEIRYFDVRNGKNGLVTRFSGEITAVDLLGNNNVVFILDGDLGICETDGTNCHELISTEEVESVAVVWEDSLAVVKGGEVYLLELGEE